MNSGTIVRNMVTKRIGIVHGSKAPGVTRTSVIYNGDNFVTYTLDVFLEVVTTEE